MTEESINILPFFDSLIKFSQKIELKHKTFFGLTVRKNYIIVKVVNYWYGIFMKNFRMEVEDEKLCKAGYTGK